jgi:uncharacterized protein YjbI with pentapeptide repeats
VATSLLIVFVLSPSIVGLSQQPTSSPANTEEELNKARSRNEEAQAEYYREQTKKLHESPTAKSFGELVSQNVPGLLGGLAALVAFISFFYNYRATLRNRIDTSFYEAMKRFGDKDSPVLRSSAAGLLAQMGQIKLGVRRKRIFLRTAVDQLNAGLLLEENSVAFMSISDALQQLSGHDPLWAMTKMYQANMKLQDDVVRALAEYLIIRNVSDLTTIKEDGWLRIEFLTGYGRDVIEDLLRKHQVTFSQYVAGAQHPYYQDASQALAIGLTTDSEEPKKQHEKEESESGQELHQRKASSIESLVSNVKRLRANVDACSIALRSYRRPGSPHWGDLLLLSVLRGKYLSAMFQQSLRNYNDIFLVRANLEQVDLRLLSLKNAQLQDSNLSYARLRGLDLSGASLKRVNLCFSNIKDANLEGAQLQDAALFASRIKNVNLAHSSLEGASLSMSRLTETVLAGAQVDERTSFFGSNWWNADFAYIKGFHKESESQSVDLQLLATLDRRTFHAKGLADLKVHPSVREYVKQSASRTRSPLK